MVGGLPEPAGACGAGSRRLISPCCRPRWLRVGRAVPFIRLQFARPRLQPLKLSFEAMATLFPHAPLELETAAQHAWGIVSTGAASPASLPTLGPPEGGTTSRTDPARRHSRLVASRHGDGDRSAPACGVRTSPATAHDRVVRAVRPHPALATPHGRMTVIASSRASTASLGVRREPPMASMASQEAPAPRPSWTRTRSVCPRSLQPSPAPPADVTAES